MADVFLSYARTNRDIAARYAEALQLENLTCFFDVKIRVGESWDEIIEREINAARAVIVLWSNVSRDSRWVKREARHGMYRSILCPALIERCDVPLEFTDVQAALLADWNFDRQHREWRRLIEGVKTLTAQAQDDRRQNSEVKFDRTQQEAFATLLVAAATSDGHFADEEREELFAISRQSRILGTMSHDEFVALSNRTHDSLERNFERTVIAAADALPPDLGAAIYVHAASIVMSDRAVKETESKFLKLLATLLRVDRATASTIEEVLQLRSSI